MTALLRKEIRLLLPSFLIALPLALSAWLIPADNVGPFAVIRESLNLLPFVFCPAMVIMLALDSFGREISSGTFSSLLAQPVSRAQIWWTKTLLLALALGFLLSVWLLSFLLHLPIRASAAITRDLILTTGLFVAVAFSGGLWTVLLFRQVAAAFWFTVLIPAALLVTITNVLDDHPEKIQTTVNIVLSLYSVGGFLWAWRLFLRAQDVAWSGGPVTLPGFRTASRQFSREEKRRRRPRLALFVREFQLHQSQFVIAGLLAILHLGLIAARHFGHGFKEYPAMEFVVNQFWVLWLVTPLLVGCASVAEERKLGTLEGQLCLPVRRRSQFAVKFFVVLALSVLFGAGMPVLLEGSRILPELHVDYSAVLNQSPLLPRGTFLQTLVSALAALQSLPFNLLGFLFLATICAVVAGFSFHASSFARNTLQALAPATLTLLLAWLLLVGAYRPEDYLDYEFWRGALIYLIGIPVMTLTLIGLTYWNYQRVQVGWNEWRLNLLTLAATLTLVMGVTTVVYHRAWECLAPLDPPHGAARLAPSQPPTLRSDGGGLAVLLPDGRLWMGRLSFMPDGSGPWIDEPKLVGMTDDKFLEGTNWASVVLFDYDGDFNWRMHAVSFTSVFLLKTDGTLWRLGSKFHSLEPQRVGTNSDWAEIFSVGDSIYFKKKDGHVLMDSRTRGKFLLDAETFNLAERSADQEKRLSVASEFTPIAGSFQVVARENGTLTLARGNGYAVDGNVRLGTESNWRAVAGDGTIVVALKADGSLWKWTFPDDPFTKPGSASVSRLGTHSDWVAIAWTGYSTIALARDGSLWQFQSEPRISELPSLLAASRRPQKLGNIFGNAP